jgi:hypothetical protein
MSRDEEYEDVNDAEIQDLIEMMKESRLSRGSRIL